MICAAILAGGLATRLHPLTLEVPKSLVDVNGEPFIAHQLRLLRSQGVEDVVVCAGHLGEMIADYVGDGSRFGMRIDFSFDGPALLGTAGALRRAAAKLGSVFFVLYGDSYLPCDYAAVSRAFEPTHQLALMTVFENAGRWGASNVEFSGGGILAYDKDNPNTRMRHIDYGLSILAARALELVPPERPYELTALFRDLLRRRQLAGLEVDQRFYEIGSLDGLREVRQLVAQQSVGRSAGG